MKTADPELMRAINRFHVMDAIRRFGPIARVEISDRTELSATTVSAITGALLDDGLIITHAHEDHYGAVLALYPRVSPEGTLPVHATAFTAGLYCNMKSLQLSNVETVRERPLLSFFLFPCWCCSLVGVTLFERR